MSHFDPDNPTERCYSMADLIEIMARLRDPDSGCPWDLKQSFETISPYTIEEAYEVADAIERGAAYELRQELGDLLFQVVYHAQMGAEAGSFDFSDVVQAICEKMVRRHPHVFGVDDLKSDDEITAMWERVKQLEKDTGDGETEPAFLSDVPIGLPGLTRAFKLQNKAARVGFDWPDHQPVLEKLQEELDELRETLTMTGPEAAERQLEEFGDLLFVMANIARHLKIDPEAALRGANEKFMRRFGHIETQLKNNGKRLEDSSLEEMEALWDEAKQLEKSLP